MASSLRGMNSVAALFTKFDPQAFLESEKRQARPAKVAKPAKVDPTLASLAALAGGAAQNLKIQDRVLDADPDGKAQARIGGGTPAKIAKPAKVDASPSAPKANGKDRADQPRICVQCNAGGPPLHLLEGSDPPVWLHPECRRFWLKDHPTTNGSHKPADQPTPDDGDMPTTLRRCFHCGKPG